MDIMPHTVLTEHHATITIFVPSATPTQVTQSTTVPLPRFQQSLQAAYQSQPHPITTAHLNKSANVITQPVSAKSPHVHCHISAADANDQVTHSPGVFPEPILHSDLKPPNPLPYFVHTPVNIEHFVNALKDHPDRNFVNYLSDGLTNGFDIGFRAMHTETLPKNLLSATEHQVAVSDALSNELQRGHIAGPFKSIPIKHLHCSPLGSREKKDGSRRLIMDLSQPRGSSINEGIQKDEFSVQYTNFDAATDLVYKTGKSSLMSKIDIKHAFRLLPVLPAQWVLLGIFWLGNFFVDTRLPFGLRSSPAIFNRFADAICWIIKHVFNIINIVHYSDDFFLVSPPHIQQANLELDITLQAFSYLNVPIALDKLEGPSTHITYLGININSEDFTISIPDNKYIELMSSFPDWLNRKKCTKQELLSLIGKLSFVCKVVRPGRTFLRRLIDLSTTVDRLHHHINLNNEARADIKWWLDFLPTWNRKSIIPESFSVTAHDIKLFTDASSHGFGAIYNNAWIQAAWPVPYTHHSIDYKELFAIVAAAITWGSNWEGKRIVFITDNRPITEIWHKGSSKSPEIMSLIRSLFLMAAQHQFSVSLKHIMGQHNPIADSISRFQMTRFRKEAPTADILPTPTPPSIWSL